MKMNKKFDIKNITNNNKFIPIWLERKNYNHNNCQAPHSIELHLTSKCNFNCQHCSYANRRKHNTEVSPEKIDRLLDNLINSVKPKGVYFSGGGEPTTLRNWDNYIEKLTQNGVEVSLITNGSLIKSKHLNVIRKLNYIAISIYSTKKEIAQQITGSKSIEHSFLLPSAIKEEPSNTVVGARCVINEFNLPEVVDIYKKAMDSGYDYIIFIPEIDYENRGIHLPIKDAEKMKSKVISSNIDETKTNLLSVAKNKFSYYKINDASNFERHIECQPIKLKTNAFINFDGEVYLCQPHIGNKDYSIGNITGDEFKDLWGSERHEELIHTLLQQWDKGDCLNCRGIGFTRSVYDYLNMPPNQPIEIIKDSFV